LLNYEERPECIPCNYSYSFKHALVGCVNVTDILQTFYKDNATMYTICLQMSQATQFRNFE